jgi:hypothetical protein
VPASNLSPDLTSAEAALSDYAVAMKAISNYGASLAGADFGPFEIGGYQYDLLSAANFPGFESESARRAAPPCNVPGAELSADDGAGSGQFRVNVSERFEFDSECNLVGPADRGISEFPVDGTRRAATGHEASEFRAHDLLQPNSAESIRKLLGPASTISDSLTTYQDLIDELTTAGTDPGILVPGDVQAAQLAWRELVAYAATLV